MGFSPFWDDVADANMIRAEAVPISRRASSDTAHLNVRAILVVATRILAESAAGVVHRLDL